MVLIDPQARPMKSPPALVKERLPSLVGSMERSANGACKLSILASNKGSEIISLNYNHDTPFTFFNMRIKCNAGCVSQCSGKPGFFLAKIKGSGFFPVKTKYYPVVSTCENIMKNASYVF